MSEVQLYPDTSSHTVSQVNTKAELSANKSCDVTGLPVLMTPEEAAELLRISVLTLSTYRSRGTGPVFIKLGGRIMYLFDDLLDYLKSRRRVSTSGEKPKGLK